MGPKFARLLSDARPSASADAIGHLGREGRMRAVASGVEAGPVMVHHQVLGRRLGAHTGRPPPDCGFSMAALYC